MTQMTKGIILFGHGARNPEYIEPFKRIRALVAAQQPAVPVEIGFLELTQPPLEASIESLVAQGVTHIKVVPIFFAPGAMCSRLAELLAMRWIASRRRVRSRGLRR
jgi:sirohydrochlorin cobaltochelatase